MNIFSYYDQFVKETILSNYDISLESYLVIYLTNTYHMVVQCLTDHYNKKDLRKKKSMYMKFFHIFDDQFRTDS